MVVVKKKSLFFCYIFSSERESEASYKRLDRYILLIFIIYYKLNAYFYANSRSFSMLIAFIPMLRGSWIHFL